MFQDTRPGGEWLDMLLYPFRYSSSLWGKQRSEQSKSYHISYSPNIISLIKQVINSVQTKYIWNYYTNTMTSQNHRTYKRCEPPSRLLTKLSHCPRQVAGPSHNFLKHKKNVVSAFRCPFWFFSVFLARSYKDTTLSYAKVPRQGLQEWQGSLLNALASLDFKLWVSDWYFSDFQ